MRATSSLYASGLRSALANRAGNRGMFENFVREQVKALQRVAGLGLARLADTSSIATALAIAAAIMVVTSGGLLALARPRPQIS